MTPYLYFFLAMQATQSTSERVFAQLKAMTASSASTSAALMVASFIVAFKLIKLSYDVMSDEQQGGFGGIRLWQVLRPILIVLAINISGTVFSAIDGAVNYISASARGSEAYAVASKLTNEVTNTINDLCGEENIRQYNESGENYVEAAEKAKNKLIASAGSVWSASLDETMDYLGEISVAKRARNRAQKQALENMRAQLTAEAQKKIDEIVASTVFSAEYKEAETNRIKAELAEAVKTRNLKRIINKEKELSEPTDFSEMFSNWQNFREAFSSGAIFNMIAFWLYDVIFFCVTGFASVVMAVLAMFFPWVLVFSLLDYFKQAIWSFIATYMSLAFYKVVASCVNYCIGNAVTIVSVYTIQNLLPQFSSAASQLGCIQGLGTTQALIYIVGFVCMTKVGSIVHMIIPGGANTGDIGSAGAGIATGALGKAAGAAHTATSGAVKVATGGTAVQQSSSSKKSAAQSQAFQSNVTNALGKITGEGN